MARVIGIDLGAYTVKVAALEAGFRVVRVASVRSFEVLPGGGSALQRSLKALSGIEEVGGDDGVTVAIPGDRVLLRLLDIPFTDPRKLQAVVGNELADEMPWELEEMVFDHLPLRPPISKVLAGSARSAEIEEVLEALSALGVSPRHVSVAPLGYGELVRRLYPTEVVAVVDLGHERSNVCIIQGGRALAARTISRGGRQITEALREVYQLPYAEAEQLKETRARLAVPQELEALSAEERQLAEVTARAVMPLSREIAMSLSVLGSRLGVQPQGVLLCGGTALLDGIDRYLGGQLRLPVTRLSFTGDEELEAAGLGQDGEVVSALSLGLALSHNRPQPLELRQGRFAFGDDTSLLRDKLLSLTAALLAVLIFAGLSAYAKLAVLRGEEARLEKRLGTETRRIFGRPMLSGRQIATKIKRTQAGASFSIPAKTAVDVLDVLSRRLPKKVEAKGARGDAKDDAKVDVKVDVTRLDIKPGKVYLKGTADSQSTVGQMVKALKEDDCFKEVSSGKVSAVADGKRQFTINIVSACF